MSDAMIAWWREFEAQAPRIDALFSRRDQDADSQWDLPEWMHAHLGAVDPALMWEFGPAVRGPGHRLVITPESRRDLRPLVRQLLALAPELEGWEFYEYRLPEDYDQALRTVEGRVGLAPTDRAVALSRGRFNLIDLTFISASFGSGGDASEESDALNVAFVAAESLLGEQTLDRWIGEIKTTADDSGSKDGEEPAMTVPLEGLRPAVEALVAEIRDSLPQRRWHETDMGEGWSMFELRPEEADDYTGQADLFVGVSAYLPPRENALQGAPFDSARYSRFGEQFCFLKIDGLEGLDGTAYDDRGDVEDALNAVLRPAGLGSVVGGGTGLRYSYVELALTEVDDSWRAMRAVLREGRIPTRTWLLFHDDDFAAEWRGVYDDTPEPPAA